MEPDLTKESRIASVEEYEHSNAAVHVYLAAITEQVRVVYPAFDGWPPEARSAVLITSAVQCLLRPEALGMGELDMGVAMYAAGMGLGTQTQQVAEERIHDVLNRLASGFCKGREQAFAAMMNMPTVGTA